MSFNILMQILIFFVIYMTGVKLSPNNTPHRTFEGK